MSARTLRMTTYAHIDAGAQMDPSLVLPDHDRVVVRIEDDGMGLSLLVARGAIEPLRAALAVAERELTTQQRGTAAA